MDAWIAFGDGAEATAARAQVSQNHERGGAAMEAFVDVRAARGFTDGVQIQRTQSGFKPVQGFEMSRGFARPFGQARTRGLKLDERLVQIRLSTMGNSVAGGADFRSALAISVRPTKGW